MNDINSNLSEVLAGLKVRESELVSLIDEIGQIDPSFPVDAYVFELEEIRTRIKNLSK